MAPLYMHCGDGLKLRNNILDVVNLNQSQDKGLMMDLRLSINLMFVSIFPNCKPAS